MPDFAFLRPEKPQASRMRRYFHDAPQAPPPKKSRTIGPGAAGAVRKNLIWASEGSDKDLIRIKITPQDMLIKQQSSNQTLAVHLRRTELFRANGWLISRGLALKTRKKTARSF